MLTEQDNELISASLDGQLSPEQDKALKQRLLQEVELNRQYQAMKSNDAALKAAFASMDEKPVPESLNELLEQQSKPKFNVRFLAMAASVLAVSVLGYYGMQGSSSSALGPNLVAALNGTASMTPVSLDSDTQFIVNQTFRHRDGRMCREFMKQSSKTKTHAVACKGKESEKWQMELQQQLPVANTGEYVTASDDSHNSVSDYLLQNIKGEPLSLDEELKFIGNK